MKKLALIALAFVTAFGITNPPDAKAHGHVGIYANFGCCAGYGGYYPYGAYPAYYYPYYVAPPPVVYEMPPPSPVVYTAPPAPPAYEVAPAAAPVAANQTSPTYIDAQGRTCRQFQSTSGGQPFGTACLQPDGSWRAVQ